MRTLHISYAPAFVSAFFDDFSEKYYQVPLLCFGVDSYLRKKALNELTWQEGLTVCDMMSGIGNNFPIINELTDGKRKIIAVDFSKQMNHHATAQDVMVMEENALHTSLSDNSMDSVVSSFGMKTMDINEYPKFVSEVLRILKPGGQFMVMEMSVPSNFGVRFLFRLYLGMLLPLLVRSFGSKFSPHHLYLYPYIQSFGNINHVETAFRQVSPTVRRISYLGGMVTGIVGMKG